MSPPPSHEPEIQTSRTSEERSRSPSQTDQGNALLPPEKSKDSGEAQADQITQVQFEAQHYTNEDWDLIRAKLEANAELSKSMLGSELQGEDFAKRMVDLVNQRKKLFAEERAKAKRNKPMTQSQLKTYMMNYLKNQGTWKITQLKNLTTKASLKRFGEELQTKTPKRLKEDEDDESKEDEPTKKSGRRRKQMARKGMHTSVDENDSEDSDKVGEHEESNTGTETPINPVPVAMKTPSVATYKIIKQGEKGVYQIVREDGTDIVYINFGAMLKSISRDDLTELYRIVMNRYGMDGPEDKLEKGFWKCLRIMFEEPLSTDSIWSELGQQKIISWRYYDTCRVHCLNLESMEVYMLSERKYPLSAEFTMSNQHKDWLVQEQTALGKDFSNPGECLRKEKILISISWTSKDILHPELILEAYIIMMFMMDHNHHEGRRYRLENIGLHTLQYSRDGYVIGGELKVFEDSAKSQRFKSFTKECSINCIVFSRSVLSATLGEILLQGRVLKLFIKNSQLFRASKKRKFDRLLQNSSIQELKEEVVIKKYNKDSFPSGSFRWEIVELKKWDGECSIPAEVGFIITCHAQDYNDNFYSSRLEYESSRIKDKDFRILDIKDNSS
ncbi:hypothetical protein Tco_0152945 [Tanacetum coccineum]